MSYFCAQAVPKKKIEGVKLLGLREFRWAKGFVGYSGGGTLKKQNLWGGVRKKTEILGGYQNLSKHGKNYFLSMLPLVGGSPHSRGLLLLVGSRGYLRGNRAICRGTYRGFLICYKTSPICR